MTRPTLLNGVTVISIEHAVAAPLCTRHLAELGARVIKVERVDGGDFARRYDASVHGHSSYFVWLNRGKESVALDLKTDAGRQALDALLARADVLVSNLGPAAIERLIDDQRIAQAFPDIIRCYINGYGEGTSSKRKAFDAIVQGEAGVTRSTGTTEAPARPSIPIADVGAGAYAFALVVAALSNRQCTPGGRRLDVSMFDVVADWMSPLLLAQKHTGDAPPPAGLHHASIVPYGAYRAADGAWVNMAIQNEGQWVRFCRQVLQAPELSDDPKYRSNELRVANRHVLEDYVASVVANLTATEIGERLELADVPWGRLNTLAETIAHPALIERDRWAPVDLPGTARAWALRDPFYIDGQAGVMKHVPELGEHTMPILSEIGLSQEQVTSMVTSGAAGAATVEVPMPPRVTHRGEP